MEDDLVCEYDSTWDTESDGDELGENTTRRSSQDKNKKAKAGFWSNSSSRNLRAAKDMQNYRHGYPNFIDEEGIEERMPNLKFYLNEIKSSPDDVSIETIHNEWKTDYKRLERVHSYIQWLFPLREPGVNYMATELTKKEIQAFRESVEAKRRLVESYELMLGFYGIQLLNRETGEVKRAENWRERFANLERNMHNNLRITRILKSLGELGFELYQAPLVRFFLEETLVRKNLSSVKRSVLDYFVFSVRDKRERRKLIRFAFQHFEPKDKFVWCPRKIQKRFKKKAERRRDSSVGNGQAPLSDEGRSQSKTKDVERDGKSMESQKQGEEDCIDSNKKSDGPSVDLESRPSVDNLPLNNGSNGDSVDGVMEQSNSIENSIENSPAKIHNEPEDEIKYTSQSASAKVPENTQQPGIPEQNQCITKIKTEDGMDTSNCSTLLSNIQDENMTTVPQQTSEGSHTVITEKQAVVESPKHSFPIALLSERAEKFPRTDSDSGVNLLDQTVSTGNMTTISLLENQGYVDTNHKNQNIRTEQVEPMETDSSVGSQDF